jgi:hypothetical protein
MGVWEYGSMGVWEYVITITRYFIYKTGLQNPFAYYT